MLTYQNVNIHWLGHDGFLIEHNGTRVYIDPFKMDKKHKASLVLITHEHFDHLSPEDLKKITTKETPILCAEQCVPALQDIGRASAMRPGETRHEAGATITAVPAYNTNKYRDPKTKTVFHPKEEGKLGFIVELGGVRIYHAGDTDNIPEMEGIECDIALLPVSGTYVMTAEEAAAAAKRINPKVAIPMHWGAIVGTEQDAQHFVQRLASSGIKTDVLQKE